MLPSAHTGITITRFHPIGTPGQGWTDADRAAWFESRRIQRSYRDEVVAKLERLGASYEVAQYGALSLDPDRYPLYVVTRRSATPGAPWALITGGVHGYETSGVQGALEFLASAAPDYAEGFNLAVVPCVSPWGYEVIDRWNPRAIDPNRSFVNDSPAEESAALMKLVRTLGPEFLVHLDLHETTDSDEQQFRPALAARRSCLRARDDPGWLLHGRRQRESPAGVSGGDRRGSRQADAHRPGRRKRRDHRVEGDATGRHQLSVWPWACALGSPGRASPAPPRSIQTAPA